MVLRILADVVGYLRAIHFADAYWHGIAFHDKVFSMTSFPTKICCWLAMALHEYLFSWAYWRGTVFCTKSFLWRCSHEICFQLARVSRIIYFTRSATVLLCHPRESLLLTWHGMSLIIYFAKPADVLLTPFFSKLVLTWCGISWIIYSWRLLMSSSWNITFLRNIILFFFFKLANQPTFIDLVSLLHWTSAIYSSFKHVSWHR